MVLMLWIPSTLVSFGSRSAGEPLTADGVVAGFVGESVGTWAIS
jgi:hypothetical protein